MGSFKKRAREYFLGKEVNIRNRNQWIQKELKALPAGIKLLDAGAGECKWRKACGHLTYVSQDICQYEGTGNGKGGQTGKWDTSRIDIVSDITDMPVGDGEFDAVLCSEVLEHLPYPELAIKEMGRITKPGGGIAIDGSFQQPDTFCAVPLLYGV